MKKGTLFCIIAAVGFGILPTIQNELILHGIPRVSCILYSNACMLAGGLEICRQKGLRAALPAGEALRLGVIGLMGMGLTPLLLTGAFAYIPVGTATVIHFLYPTVVTVGSAVLFRNRMGPAALAAIALSIAGMACISLPGGAGGGSGTGYLLALASSFTYAFYIMGPALLGTGELPLPVSLVSMAGGNVVIFFTAALCTGGLVLPDSLGMWLLVLCYCGMMAGCYALLSCGIRLIGPVDASFSTLVEPVTSVVCSTMVYGDPLTALSLLGFGLIFGSVWLNGRG
jgi:drug/metabolite transporter (DMT)-like permease